MSVLVPPELCGPLRTLAIAAAESPNESFGTSVSKAITSSSPIAGLFQGNLWLRVAEVALGLLLIAIGLAKLTNAVPIATTVAAAVK